MSSFLAIDGSSPTPVFRQVAESLRASIACGAVTPGTRLPGVRALAETFGVNPNTVHRAVAELERDGLVRPERGVGMVVLDTGRDRARDGSELEIEARFVDALRLARAANLDDERVEQILGRARRQIGTGTPGGPP